MTAAAHVALVTEGDAVVGLGHVSRCLAIARAALAAGARVSFLITPEPRAAALVASLGVPVVEQPWPADPAAALAALRALRPDAVVVDSYKAGPEIFRALGRVAPAVAAVDDTAERELPVDLVVNGGVAAEALPYRRDRGTVYLLGPRYALLDPGYAAAPAPRARPRVERVLLSLGGGFTDALPTAVRAADRALDGATLDVAAGSFAAGAAALDAVARGSRNRVVLHRGRFGLRDLMLEADLAVSGAGMTLLELAATATPTVLVRMAENQRPNADGAVRLGAAALAGGADDPGLGAAIEAALGRLAADPPARAALGGRARALVDGRGAARAVEAILRPAAVGR